MNITQIKIRKMFSSGKLKAVVSITIDDCFAIHDIKIVEGKTRLFAAMPSRTDANGVFHNIVHPINSELRKELEDKIIDAYKRACVETENESLKSEHPEI